MILFHDFDALRHRTKITCTLVLKSGMRVGKGRSYDALISDLPVQEYQGRPMIPGSSLKGIFRSSAEKLLRGIALNELKDQEKKEELLVRIASDPLVQSAGTKEITDKNVCMITATYGGMGLASHVRFCDALAEEHTFEVKKRDGVAINRDLGRVHGNAKYDYEVIEPQARFPLEIILENDQDWQLDLVLASLDMLEDGLLRIGGFASRGLGRVEVHDVQIKRASITQLLQKEEGDMIQDVSEENGFYNTMKKWITEITKNTGEDNV